jgi:hypothetical protein
VATADIALSVLQPEMVSQFRMSSRFRRAVIELVIVALLPRVISGFHSCANALVERRVSQRSCQRFG